MDNKETGLMFISPLVYSNILDQIFEIERKLEGLKEPNSISRNIEKIKVFFAEIFGTPSDPEVGLFYHDPLGEKYDETRTDIDVTIAGESADNLVVTEVIKPIIRRGRKGKKCESQCVRKGVVVVESKTTRKDIEKEQPEDKKEESGETTETSDSGQEPKLADKEKPESQEREDESKQLTSAENEQLVDKKEEPAESKDTSDTEEEPPEEKQAESSASSDSSGSTQQEQQQEESGKGTSQVDKPEAAPVGSDQKDTAETQQRGSGQDINDQLAQGQQQTGDTSGTEKKDSKPTDSAGQGKQPEEPDTQTASGGQ